MGRVISAKPCPRRGERCRSGEPACRSQGSRELVLGRSLSEFMRALGVYSSSGGTQARLRSVRPIFSRPHVSTAPATAP